LFLNVATPSPLLYSYSKIRRTDYTVATTDHLVVATAGSRMGLDQG